MAKELKILNHPHPLLRKMSIPVDLADLKNPKFKTFFPDLIATMLAKDGLGIAAPQVGENIRVFAMVYQTKPIILINPIITKRSWAKVIDDEGCLSVLDEAGNFIYGPVERHRRINCLYYNEQGDKKKLVLEDLAARVVQHEIDHLDGILFLDRLVDKPTDPQSSQS